MILVYLPYCILCKSCGCMYTVYYVEKYNVTLSEFKVYNAVYKHYALYIVYYALYTNNMYCALYTVQCTLYGVHCTMYILNYAYTHMYIYMHALRKMNLIYIPTLHTCLLYRCTLSARIVTILRNTIVSLIHNALL